MPTAACHPSTNLLRLEIRSILDAANQADADDTTTQEPEPDSDSPSASDSGSGSGSGFSVRRRVGLENKLTRVVEEQGAMVEAVERRQAAERRHGKRNRGEVKVNVTDPESRLQKTRRGWVQQCQRQSVSADQIVVAADVTPKSTDVEMLIPMIALAQANLGTVGVTDTVNHVLADAGYWSADNFTFEKTSSTMLVVATKNRHTKTKPVDPLRVTGKTRARFLMEQRLGDDTFKELYLVSCTHGGRILCPYQDTETNR